MLEGKSTASEDALGCGVCYGAAPSAQFLPQADIWPLRAVPAGDTVSSRGVGSGERAVLFRLVMIIRLRLLRAGALQM